MCSTLHVSSQFCIQPCHVSSLKLVTAGIVTPQKSINATHQGFLPQVPVRHLLAPHRTPPPTACGSWCAMGDSQLAGCPPLLPAWDRTVLSARPEGEEVEGNPQTSLTLPRAPQGRAWLPGGVPRTISGTQEGEEVMRVISRNERRRS